MSQPPSASGLPDWDQLGFGFVETDTMFRAGGELGREPVWDEGQLEPFGAVGLSPAAALLSYGIGVFEGLKARRARDGRILLFRTRANARRFQASAERMMMAPFPADRFVTAVEAVVRGNTRFVPPPGKGAFYVRPMQHAVEPKLGIRPCSEYQVLIYGCPVGSYFASNPDAARGVRLRVVEQARCATGGTGAAKAMGNYAGGIAVAAPWQRRGFDDVLYLDARRLQDVTETSGSNVFCLLRNGVLVTPELTDQILPGITRDSVIRVARELLGVTVEERPLPLAELLDDGVEVFCTGTAWTVQAVSEIDHRDRVHRFDSRELQPALLEAVSGIQAGEREDPFGWVTEVRA